MSTKRRALGRGLSSLIPETPPIPGPATGVAPGGGVIELDLDRIRPGRHQPRSRFDEAGVRELAESIRQTGVIQPVIVTRDEEGYVLVAGERRWRAAQQAGLLRIPALVREIDEEHRLEFALIENLQREDLNCIEEARAYRAMVHELGLTQVDIARRVGKSSSAVANALRLLELPGPVQRLVEEGRLPMGHARALLGLEDQGLQSRIAAEAVERGLSTRQVERKVQQLRTGGPRQRKGRPPLDPNVAAAEERLSLALRSRVRIRAGRGKGGRLEIHFRDGEELQRLYELIEKAARQ